MTVMPIHPDDILLYKEVKDAAERIAQKYGLPLKRVEGLPMPRAGMADRMGDCSHDGVIRIVFRCTVDGKWCDEPMSPKEVWDTVAHELSHLRFWDHGAAHTEFMHELMQACGNQQEDHKQKILKKLVKMQRQRDGEAALGNAEAAEAFAGAINRMLIEYELNPNQIDYAAASDNDPVIEVKVDWKQHMRPGDDPNLYKSSKRRIAWQETLARVVANAHLCCFLITLHSDDIWFVGTKAHAVVAEYVYSTLVLATYKMVTEETRRFRSQCNRDGRKSLALGFKDSWLDSFINRINQRFEEERKAAVKAATVDAVGVPRAEDQALMRLSGALTKAKTYVDHKFHGRKGVNSASMKFGSNSYGRAAGRAAADRIQLGRRGLETAARTPKRLED